jgi:glucokinase
MRVLAVELGGTHASCGAVEGGRLLESFSIEVDSRRNLGELLPTLEQALHELMARHPGTYSGLGFGFCGLVNAREGKVLATNGKFPDATELDLPRWAHDTFDLPMMLENDARMALLGEWRAGSARGTDDVVMITLGTGIGTAVLCRGRLLRGKHFQAGCLGGHFTVAPGGRLCSCGARGCFEAEASTYALANMSRAWPGFGSSALAKEDNIHFETLFRWAERGDAVAMEIREYCVQIWSACALSLVHAYDPELIVVGGGVMKNSYPILKRLQTHVQEQAWTPWGKVQFRTAALGSDAALFGAEPLIEQQHAF